MLDSGVGLVRPVRDRFGSRAMILRRAANEESEKNGFEKLAEQIRRQFGKEAVLHRAAFRSNQNAYDCLADFSFYDKQCRTCPFNMAVVVVEFDDGYTLAIGGRLTREQNREIMTKWQALGRARIKPQRASRNERGVSCRAGLYRSFGRCSARAARR